MVDFTSRTDERIIKRTGVVDAPAFSRNGKHPAFHSAEGGRLQLFVKAFPTGAPTRIATSLATGIVTPDWSADGRMLIASTRGRIVAIPLETPNEPRTVVENGVQPRLSPDGTWLAYTSTVSGTAEVYVQRFPDGGERTRVSLNGGFQPQWRRDGKELYYLTSEGAVMAVPLKSGSVFGREPAVQLFKERFRDDGASFLRRDFLPGGDGDRFLLNLQAGAQVPMTAIRNWLTPATPH
jgi:Tol biopolymer transport system component